MGTFENISGSLVGVYFPNEPAFDTYSLKAASDDEIKKVEKG